MAITDHVGILLYSSLDKPVTNPKDPTKPAAYYAVFAFPPAAGNDLQAVLASVAPGGSLAGQKVGVKTNSSQTKPVAGVPGDWLVFRAQTQFPFTILGQNGDAVDPTAVRSTFYPGRRVRTLVSAYAWKHPQSGTGISLNLNGIMDAGEGERLEIGEDKAAKAFAQFANPNAAPASAASDNPFGSQSPSPAPAPAPPNPFQQ